MKTCDTCGCSFHKRERDSAEQWAERQYCSRTCANRSRDSKPVHLRFWLHVAKAGANECWLWRGGKDGNGYGTLAAPNAPLKAHRVAWELRNGEIPQGMVICHKCDTPACVNPRHLFLGVQKDNMADCARKGRLNPVSRLNLRPGRAGFYGAGPISTKEKASARSE